MPSLDARGKISVGIAIIYPVVTLLTVFLIIRHGCSKQTGWIYLLIFAVAQAVAGVLQIISEKQTNPSTTLLATALGLESGIVGPLLGCLVSLMGIAATRLFDTDSTFIKRFQFKLLHVIFIIGTGIIATGASDLSNANGSEDKQNKGRTLRKVGCVVLGLGYGLVLACAAVFWSSRRDMFPFHRKFFNGIAISLPFLAIRIIYAILSGFSPISTSSDGQVQSSDGFLSKFNTLTGSWAIFLFMNVLPELIAILIWLFVGLRLPTVPSKEELEGAGLASASEDRVPMYPPPAQPPQYQYAPYKGGPRYTPVPHGEQ